MATDPRVLLLDRLHDRLERMERLDVEMRDGLRRADAASIDEATARLETVALEFKILEREYHALPPMPDDVAVAAARTRLDEAATRLARTAAVSGGLLERLVGLTRRLRDGIRATDGETYLPTGRARDAAEEGRRLRERA